MDRNLKGETRLRFADESPWNDQKEEHLLRNVEWMTFDSNNECDNFLQDMKALAFHHHDLVDRGVLLEIATGSREAIWMAVDQIHHRSLMRGKPIGESGGAKDTVKEVSPRVSSKIERTYAEVAKSPLIDGGGMEKEIKTRKMSQRVERGDTIFVT